MLFQRRSKPPKYLYQVSRLLPAALMLAATGCSSLTPSERPFASAAEPAYVMTVKLKPSDTRAGIERRYGGHVAVWQEHDYAVLGVDKGLTVQTDAPGAQLNQNVFLASGRAAWMEGTSRIWAGGKSRIWAGGASQTWFTEALWDQNTFTWMPENSEVWKQIHLQAGQAIAKNLGRGVKVAVIDTGIDLAHPALQEALAPASEWYDFYADDAVPQEEGTLDDVGYGHGTNVAGIIRQVAPRATILPIRVLGSDGMGDVDDLAAAVKWAVDRGANIINLSLGSDAAYTAIDSVLKTATSKGVIVVASVGNTNNTALSFPGNTGMSPQVGAYRLGVTSVDANDNKSAFANYGVAGNDVEFAAPGENIWGPAPELSTAAWTGTSQAAPMVSGALALALGQRLSVTQARVADTLRNTGDFLYNGKNSAYMNLIGKGRLNVAAFLTAVGVK